MIRCCIGTNNSRGRNLGGCVNVAVLERKSRTTKESAGRTLASLVVCLVISSLGSLDYAWSQATDYEIKLLSRQFTPPADITQGIMDIQATGLSRVHVMMQFFAVPTAVQRGTLRASGIRLLQGLPENAYFASVPSSVSASDPALAPVRWIGMLAPADKIEPRVLAHGVGEWAQTSGGRALLRVSFFDDIADTDALAVISKYGGSIQGEYKPLSYSFEIVVHPQKIAALAGEDAVRWITDTASPPEETNDGFRASTKTDAAHALGLKGEGINVGLWDGGEVGTHGDLAARLTVVDKKGGLNKGLSNHATHVAGTMAGDGSTQAARKGHAPAAPKIFSYDFFPTRPAGAAQDVLVPKEMENSFGTDKIAVSNNSWGRGIGWRSKVQGDSPDPVSGNAHFFPNSQSDFGNYSAQSPDFDAVVRKGLVIAFAAGNDRSDPTLEGVLANAVDAKANVLVLASTERFPQPPATITAENEEVSYTGKENSKLTGAVRGANGTAAAAHTVDSIVAVKNTLTKTLLARGLTAAANEIELVAVAAFPAAGTVVIDNEEITYTAKTTGTRLTGVARGQNGTIAVAHPAAAKITLATKAQPADGNKAGVPAGRGIDPANVPPGYYTMSPNATGKNVITVGAIVDAQRGQPAEPITVFSNWGPTDDGRTQPDVVAPGFQINSALAVPANGYGAKSGTSMATPAVSGISALVIQAYKKTFNRDPLPSTVKDVLVCTAEDKGNPGPDFVFGWGKVDAEAAVKLVQSKSVIEDSVADKQKKTFRFKVKRDTAKLKLTLTWDDVPAADNAAKTLENDLDLALVAPDGTRHMPWKLDAARPAENARRDRGKDTINNVEQVEIPGRPDAGLWTAEVTGSSVAKQPPQKFSLCAPAPIDFGDAPDKGQPQDYPSLLEHNGALD